MSIVILHKNGERSAIECDGYEEEMFKDRIVVYDIIEKMRKEKGMIILPNIAGYYVEN